MEDERTADLGFARVDVDRATRTGDPEVVYGAGKTPDEVSALLSTLHRRHPDRAVLATKLTPEAMAAAAAVGATVHETARAATLGPVPEPRGLVGVISAGTSDAPVSAEAALTVAVHGAGVEEIHDVGVAGLHRLLAVRDRLDERLQLDPQLVGHELEWRSVRERYDHRDAVEVHDGGDRSEGLGERERHWHSFTGVRIDECDSVDSGEVGEAAEELADVTHVVGEEERGVVRVEQVHAVSRRPSEVC